MATKLIKFNIFNMYRPRSLTEIKVAINVDADEARRQISELRACKVSQVCQWFD